MLVNYSERIGTQREPVKIQVFLPGIVQPAIEAQLPEEQLRTILPQPPDTPKANFCSVLMPIVMGPVTFVEKGTVKVLAIIGDRVQRLGLLRILPAPIAAAQVEPEKKEAAN